MFKRYIALLLAALTAVSLLCACSGSGSGNNVSIESTADAQTDAQSETIEAETTDSYVYDDIPDTDYEGADLNILTTTWYEASSYIYAENLNGEVINDALYNDRINIQDRFNVSINLTANDDFGIVATNVDKMALAGDDSYDLVYNHDLKTVGNALKGDFVNLRGIDAIDFSKPWWNGTSEVFTISGKLMFTANTLSLSGIYMNYILSYNKDLAEANGITIPYDDVRAGSWYLDDLIALTQDMAKDIDGDGKLTENDQYGYLTSYFGDMGMQSDLGGTVLTKDENGCLTFIQDENRIVSILEKVERLYENGANSYGASNEYGADLFVKGQGLFMFTEGRILYTKVRSYDIVYGILPFPKYDETQENYQSSGCDIYWGILLPAAGRADMIGTIVSAMSCYNYNNVVPSVWELVLGSKLADSPDDADMFEIIRDVQYVDLGYAFSGESPKLTDLIFLTNKTTSDKVISYIETRRDSVISKLDDLNAVFSAFE